MNSETYLQMHDVVDVFRRLHRVTMVNESRAKVVPLKRSNRTFEPQTGANAGKQVQFPENEEGHSISPNAPLEILGKYDPASGNVKWKRETFIGVDPASDGDHAVRVEAEVKPDGSMDIIKVTNLTQSDLL